MHRLALFALLFMTACAQQVTTPQIQERAIERHDFYSFLRAEYYQFAAKEAEHEEWPDHQYYTEKANKAAHGKQVMPERPELYMIQPDKQAELGAAYAQLTGYLASPLRVQIPEALARLQALYDCWVDQEEEGWIHPQHVRCRDEFIIRSNALVKPITPEGKVIGPFEIETIVYFESAKNHLSSGAKDKLDYIAEIVKSSKEYHVRIDGHADRADSDQVNITLSEKRAQAVAKALAERGVSAQHMKLFHHGEKRTQVDTKDGMHEPLNRRVEVRVNGMR